MRTLRLLGLLLCVVLLGVSLAGCRSTGPTATSGPTVTIDQAGPMKGYELYSWRDRDQWYFSVLIGTNRDKTVDEIRSPGSMLKGVDALLGALESIPPGQYVTWLSRNTLSFPSDDVIGQVEQICKDRGLLLSIAK